jgi:hypothetical protein
MHVYSYIKNVTILNGRIKVKMSLCLTKHHPMNAYVGVEELLWHS